MICAQKTLTINFDRNLEYKNKIEFRIYEVEPEC